MIQLNLPNFDYKIKNEENQKFIFDIIRKKYILITPEEWVRQHFIHFLINQLSYSKGLLKVEGGLRYNRLSKRSDILVYDRNASPFMLIECKAPEVKISQAVFEQAALYNKTIKAEYLTITNGLRHFCCKIDHENGSYSFTKNLPPFSEINAN